MEEHKAVDAGDATAVGGCGCDGHARQSLMMTMMGRECLAAFATGDTSRASELATSLIIGHDDYGGSDSSTPLHQHRRELCVLNLGPNQQPSPGACGGDDNGDGNNSDGNHHHPVLSAALGQLVWFYLVITDPRLLQPLWPLEVSVLSHAAAMKTKAKGQPLSVQQWMVEFLTDVISSSSSATVEPGTDGGNKTASLAHFLLGVVLSKGHGEWTFTAETKSMEHIKIAAEGGDQRAQFWLWRYCGREKYREYLHRSASHGYCPALFILAQQCLRDVPVNTSEGLRLLRIGAVEKGDPSSQLELGCLLLEQGNSGEAFRLLKLASDQGLPEGQNALAVCYSQRTPFASGCCGERNDQEALRLWKLSADQGLAASQFMLGHCYMSGDIVPQDYESAAMYLSLAAKAGIPQAQYFLATLYVEGRGVEEDAAKGVMLLQKASEGGLISAHMRLGTMYTKGTSATPQNFTLALKHFQAAVEQGNPQAAFAVARLILFGYVPGATTREALELLHKACTPSIPDEVASTIGGVYEGGGGGTGGSTTKDVREAVRWYKLAVDSNPSSDKGNAQQKLRPYLHPASNEDEED